MTLDSDTPALLVRESMWNADGDSDFWRMQFSTLSGMAVMLRMARGVPPDTNRHW